MSDQFDDNMTLEQARAVLRTLVGEGAHCPCCKQFAKVYRRSINSAMARDLIEMWKADRTPGSWVYLPDVRKRSGSKSNREESKLRYWGLIEEDDQRRDDGGRAGWWRLTPLGVQWVGDQVAVPKYAAVYDGRCLSLRGEPITIRQALGTKFDYAELMAA